MEGVGGKFSCRADDHNRHRHQVGGAYHSVGYNPCPFDHIAARQIRLADHESVCQVCHRTCDPFHVSDVCGQKSCYLDYLLEVVVEYSRGEVGVPDHPCCHPISSSSTALGPGYQQGRLVRLSYDVCLGLHDHDGCGDSPPSPVDRFYADHPRLALDACLYPGVICREICYACLYLDPFHYLCLDCSCAFLHNHDPDAYPVSPCPFL